MRAIVIRSGHRFAWLGVPSPPVSRALASALPDGAASAILVKSLTARLYESFYCPGRVVAIGDTLGDLSTPADTALVATLSLANVGRGSWEPGWRVAGIEEGVFIVVRDGIRVWAEPSECRTSSGAPRIGTEVSIALPSELPALSPGFFTAVGDVDLQPESDDLIARLYFNVTCVGAPALVAEATSVLNRARVPFRMKVLDHPARFGRCDAAVVYLNASDVRHRRKLLRGLVRSCADELRARTPIFTKPLAPGVGLGEERGDARESFGMRRCRILAEALVDAHQHQLGDLPKRLLMVENHFANAGIDLKAPYLERGSEDGYSL